jgi:hypothetical protein
MQGLIVGLKRIKAMGGSKASLVISLSKLPKYLTPTN